MNIIKKENIIPNSYEEKEVQSEKNEIKEVVLEFKDISKGDIIFAKRVADIKLPERHKCGPFLVLENKGTSLICLYGTGTLKSKERNSITILNSDYDFLLKDTLYNFLNIDEIKKENFIKKLGSLNNDDMNLLQKKINLKSSNYKKYQTEKKLEERDIFKYNKKIYLVYKIENNIITAIKLTNNKTDYSFLSNNEIKYTDFKEIIEIKDNNFKARDFVLKKNYKIFLLQYKRYLEKQEKQNVIQRGCIILLNNKLIYIYGEEGQNYLVYYVEETNKSKNFIKINNQKYLADFDNVFKILKNHNYQILSIASEEEIEYNKEVKKAYNKNSSKPKKKVEKSIIKEGVVVIDKTLMHTEYIVLKRNGNEVLTIRKENNNIYFEYFDVKELNFKRNLQKEEFKNLLLEIRNNRHIGEEEIKSLINKYSN